MHKHLFSIFLFAIAPLSLLAQRHTVSGIVVERGSRETLIGATVVVVGKTAGVATNAYGFYSITLPEADSVVLEFSYVGYVPQRIAVGLRRSQTLNVELVPATHDIEQVVVNAESRTSSRSAQMSVVELPIRQAKAIPMLLGEKDMLKALQLMPGVQSGGEGNSAIYVRGGGPDQNLIILDDATVYNVFHLFGFVSLFNGDSIKNIDLIKGGFPARYGGRLSSVLDIAMRDGRKDSLGGEASIGLLSSRLMLEGPIIKDKASFLVSGRRTYVDLFMRPVLKSMDGVENFGCYFYDLTAKLNWEVNARNKLFLSGYFGRDKIYVEYNDKESEPPVEDKQGEVWGNATATLRWNHIFSNRLFSNLSVIFSNYRFDIYSSMMAKGDSTIISSRSYQSGIRDYGLKYDFIWYPNPNHTVRLGAVATLHNYRPEVKIVRDDYATIDTRDEMLYQQLETALYAEDEVRVGSLGVVNLGARMSAFRLGDGSIRPHFEPRASLTAYINDHSSIKASYALMNQYLHLLSNTGTGMPTDLWVPATENVPAQRSWQVALGYAYDLRAWHTTLSAEAYYKQMSNVIAYLPGASQLSFGLKHAVAGGSTWERNVTIGTGNAYGLELMAHRKNGRLQGWVGYTLAWVKHRFELINHGRPFYPKYDRRHDVSIVVTYDYSDKIKLSATWVYGTGNYINLPVSHYELKTFDGSGGRGNQDAYTEINEFRMSPYHRLDLAAQFYNYKGRTTRIWEVGLYNAYNHLNPYYYTLSLHPTRYDVRTINKVGMFPILPSISWTIKF